MNRALTSSWMVSLFGIPRAALGRVGVAFTTLLLVMAGHAMLETARDALFLTSLPASRLPWVYLAIAGLALAVTRLNRFVTDRWSRRRVVAMTLIGSAGVTSLFWFATAGGSATLYVFYAWTGLVASIAVIQLWMLFSEELDPAQAKRAFGVIGAGGLLGATLGSALSAAVLQLELGPRHLILFGSVVLLAAGAVPAVAWRSTAAPTPRTRRPPPPEPSTALAHPYLRRLLVLVILAQMVVTAADLLFKAAVAHAVPAEQLGSFFALFYTALNAISLAIQLFAAGWLLRHLGVNRSLWALPLLIGGAALGFGLSAGLLPILLLKVFDGALRHSLQRTGIELLYLPLPRRVRQRHKVTIDAAGARLGQAAAALAILGGLSFGVPTEHLAFALVGLVIGLLASISAIRDPYVELFRRGLHERTIEARASIPPLDLDSLETLVAGMASDDDAVALAALELLARCGRIRLVSPLILHHPSPEVVSRALRLLQESGRRDFVPLARRLLDAPEPAVRRAAVRALCAAAPEATDLDALLRDRSVEVRATALVALAERAPAAEIDAGVRALVDQGGTEGRLALIDAIRDRPGPRFRPVLVELAARGEPALWQSIARTMAAGPDLSFVPHLVPMLADRHARPDVRAALVALGGPALAALERALGDPATARQVRLHVPRTVSRFRSQQAADVLCRHLEREIDGAVGYKILRGLGRMIADDPRTRIDPRLIQRILDAQLRRAVTMLAWRLALTGPDEPGPATRLLQELLREKESAAVERVFRLLGMAHPREDFHAIYAGLRGGDQHLAAYSRELIDSLVAPPRRGAIQALVAGAGDDDRARLRGAASFHRPAPADPIALLSALGRDPSEVIASLAAAASEEIGRAPPARARADHRASAPEVERV